MHFQKEDMEGTHYNWDAESDTDVFTGNPSRRPFDRYNGYQVLFLINFYGLSSNEFTVLDGRKIEREIFHYLPIGLKSEISVFNWITNTLSPQKQIQ